MRRKPKPQKRQRKSMATAPSNSLVIFTKAALMLAEADTIQKAKELKSLALTAADYAKRKGMGRDAVRHCKSYALEAERKMGEMLALNGLQKPGEHWKKKRSPQSTVTSTIKELGLSKDESSEAQALAALPQEVFESLLNEEVGRKVLMRGFRKKKRKAANLKKEKEALAAAPTKRLWAVTDVQDVIPCTALITDPPYGILTEKWEPGAGGIEDLTRQWATKWNECGADFILSFFSQRFMWAGKTWFDESLLNYQFQQLLVWHYPNNKSPQSRDGFKQTWEPIFFYRRKDSKRQVKVGGSEWGEGLNDFDCHVAAVPQTNFKGSETKQHPAQKPVSVMRWLVNATTQIGEMVVDPFCGSGTTGIAAASLHRQFHGIETDANYRKLSERRIATYGV